MNTFKIHNLMNFCAGLYFLDAAWILVMSQAEGASAEPFQTGLLFVILGVVLKDKDHSASPEGDKFAGSNKAS